MTQFPTGTVTFLFTDIEGSTGRWDEFPDAMRAALERHDALMRAAVDANAGQVFKTVGDAFCAAFTTAGAGLAAAIEAQRAIAAEDWSRFGDGFPPILVRMGLHTGEATERGGDYFGQPVNRVARLEASGHGGQVLLSGAAYKIVRELLPIGFELIDRGQHRLKDLRHTEHIFQLRGPGLPEVDTPPGTAEALHPRDRVRVADPAPGSTPGAETPTREANGVWASLEAALRSDAGEAITLTPAEATELARHKPADLREYRLGRVAEWSQPRYRLDGRFVGLTLLIDQGEEAVQGRWQAAEERYEDLGDLLTDNPDPAIVVLGPPGGGKSTLLRRLELDTAIAGLRGEADSDDRVTFFISLNSYKPVRPGDPVPEPGEWLSDRWASRSPDLPPLDDLLSEGRVTLLLDALNEMPAAGESEFRERVQLWKDWLVRLASDHPGNRVVFSCRSLDYSQSLSTPDLRVPQVRIESLTDDQIRDFLMVYSPGRWREIWSALEGSPQLEVLRSPYFLALLVEQVEASGEMPAGRAALFTGFVRQALRREVERGSPLFEPGELLESRDLRRIAKWQWKGPYDLPDRGKLIPKLAALAHAMQQARDDAGGSQVRVDFDDALDLLNDSADEAIVQAGEALSVLDEDEAAGELMYIHQLVQEYFAARELAREPDPELVRIEWRAARSSPSVDEVIDSLDPADPLPSLPGTGWEETTILAAAMAEDPPSFLRGVMDTNLALAGRAAAQPELMSRLPADLLGDLRWALVKRSRDPEADLRDRIACGYALGDLGDPRFERRTGPHGTYLLPPLVEIAGGTYPIGDDEPITTPQGTWTDHIPRHEVEVARFAIGQFPLTNAEWRCFLESGGYEDERWWDTDPARAWRLGENTAAGIHDSAREFVARCRKRPEVMDELLAAGSWDEELYERGQSRVAMSAEELDAHLVELYPGGRHTEPACWRDVRFNRPAQPVVGVCWYEARAYLRWLSEQSRLAFRLPTEVEWEAAARGTAGRCYAYGDVFDRLRCNMAETHIRQTTPVGVFPGGDTPEGVCDLTGNVIERASSAFGKGFGATEYPYPYTIEDGREEAEAPADMQRVSRGGSWYDDRSVILALHRDYDHPGNRDNLSSVRVAV
ncbi:MAG: SUMF1/EgtB/PvdO family nonheme iron enzyme [Caldilineae bacterium]|nr:SUMF1/EgtB/PvdO family nonheme iron enzyme [Chloroflexota bacterium]MCB9177040.1 SUMF1/EgtB/PvdO family nonheme iron enzyme [Caldilineae bacterium]